MRRTAFVDDYLFAFSGAAVTAARTDEANVPVSVVVLNNLFENRLSNADDLQLFQNFVVGSSAVWGTSLFLVITGCVVGAIGSGIAVSRFLDV